MKKSITVLILITFVLLTGCSMSLNYTEQSNYNAASDETTSTKLELFTDNKNGGLVAPDGTEYTFLCNEGFLELLGTKQLIGKVSGEYDSEP
jgi:hypothetical protein